MATTLQIVDPDALTNVLFDLNDSTATNSGLYGSVATYLLADPDWGAPELNTTEAADAATPTAFLSFSQQALADVRLGVRITGSSYDNLAKATGTLGTYLSQGCVMKWIANGSTEVRYIDIEPSLTPVLLHGQERAMWQATTLFDTPEGVELRLRRQPLMRGVALAPALNLLNNGTLIRDANVDGTPNNWTLQASTTSAITSASDAVRLTTTAAGSADLLKQTGTIAGGSTVVASVEVRKISGDGTMNLVIYNDPSGVSIATGTATSSATWTRITVTGTSTGGQTGVQVSLHQATGTGTNVYEWRNAQLETGATASYFRTKAETVTVDPSATTGFVNILPIYNPGTAPAPVSIRATFPDASNLTTTLLLGLRATEGVTGRYDVSDYLNTTHRAAADSSVNGWTVALGTDTSVVSSNAQVSHTTARTTITKRVSFERTTLLDSLRGDFDVYARVRGNGARKFRLQLRWAYGNTDPMPNVNDEYVHDITDASAFTFVEVQLGRISIPVETDSVLLGKIKLELWTAQQSGSAQTLDIDYLRFVPSNAAWVLTPSGNATRWDADQLTTPVTSPAGGTAMTIGARSALGFFDDLTDNAGTPTIASAGHHATTFVLGAQNYNGTDRTLKLCIRNTFTNTDEASLPLVTVTAGTNRKARTIEWDAAGGSNTYQAQVDDPSNVGTKYLYVKQITDRFTPVFEQNSSFQSDPGSRPTRRVNEKLDSSANALFQLDGTGVPFWAPPGLSLVYIEAWDTIAKYYTEPAHNLARTMTVQATVYPRWWV